AGPADGNVGPVVRFRLPVAVPGYQSVRGWRWARAVRRRLHRAFRSRWVGRHPGRRAGSVAHYPASALEPRPFARVRIIRGWRASAVVDGAPTADDHVRINKSMQGNSRGQGTDN